MKKFFIILAILVVAGGAGFFFGWAQLTVPPGAYGVLQSKTHGVDPRPVQAGEFRWLWYKLIPKNVTLTVFHLEPVQRTVNARGSLPSGDVYSAFAGEQMDFSWEFNAAFSFSLSPDALASVVSENNITTQDALNQYLNNLAGSVESVILRGVNSGETPDDLEAFMSGFGEKIENAAREQFPVIRDFSCVVKNVRFPDFILYKQVRGLYEDYIATQRNYAASALSQKAEDRIDSRVRFEELERYGELLTKYPILLDYLALSKDQEAQ